MIESWKLHDRIQEREEVKEKLREVSLEEILEKQALHQAEKEETDRLRYTECLISFYSINYYHKSAFGYYKNICNH